MNILMICTIYPREGGDSYMTNELAAALAEAGHSVQVVLTDWRAPAGSKSEHFTPTKGVHVLAIAPRCLTWLGRFVEKASKWTFSSVFAWTRMRSVLANRSFDAMICFTPCVTVAAQLVWAAQH